MPSYNLPELFDHFRKELELHEFNVTDAAYNNPEKTHEVVVRLLIAKNHLSELNRYEKLLYKLLNEHYKYNYPQKLKTKDEIDRYIYSNETYQQLNSLITNLQNSVEYFERLVKIFEQRNFSISNISKLMGV